MASADVYIATKLLVADEDWAAARPLLFPLCGSGRMWDTVWTTVDNSDDYTDEPWSENCGGREGGERFRKMYEESQSTQTDVRDVRRLE
jgi:hypothetical protein